MVSFICSMLVCLCCRFHTVRLTWWVIGLALFFQSLHCLLAFCLSTNYNESVTNFLKVPKFWEVFLDYSEAWNFSFLTDTLIGSANAIMDIFASVPVYNVFQSFILDDRRDFHLQHLIVWFIPFTLEPLKSCMHHH